MFISRKGCSPDNAACEKKGFFGRLKSEFYFGSILGVTAETFA